MRIGLTTDSLGHLPFDELLATAANLGIQTLEFGCGGWSSAPHLNLNALLENQVERANFVAKIRAHGMEISALNCSGNQLAPGERGKSYDQVVRGTLRLAGLLGVQRIVMMSGLPGGPGDQNANWITTAWPPELILTPVTRCGWEGIHCAPFANYRARSIMSMPRIRGSTPKTARSTPCWKRNRMTGSLNVPGIM